jgi:hypothetical protein
MVAAINWESSPSLTSYLTTELNSLADGAGVLGAEIDNSTGLDTFLDLEVYVDTQGSARSAGAYISVHVIKALDGTNYEDYAGSTPPAIWTRSMDAATTARRLASEFPLPAGQGKFKLYVVNHTGQAWPASGNTMGYRLYSLESQ